MKNPLWKQPTPQMQYVVLVMTLDGWVTIIENALEDTAPNMERITPKLRDITKQMRALIPFIEGKEKWE